MPDITTIVFPTSDLAAATTAFARLAGRPPHTDSPYYVGFRVGDIELGLDPNGAAAGLAGPVVYWQVPDISTAVADLVALGGAPRQAVTDVGGGKLIATLDISGGSVVGLMQAG